MEQLRERWLDINILESESLMKRAFLISDAELNKRRAGNIDADDKEK